MKYCFLICLFFYILLTKINAQNGHFVMGAKSAALSDASVTIADNWALFNNIGALADVSGINGFAAYRNLYGLSDLSSIAAGAVAPVWKGVMGLGMYRYGGKLLNEHRANLGFSMRLGLISLGTNLSYYQLSIENGGTNGVMMIDFGGLAKLSDQFYFGAHISNINQSKISNYSEQRLPTIMKTGVSYRPNTAIMLNAEIEKEVEAQTLLKFGLSYEIIDHIHIRTGVQSRPFKSNFGLGFELGKIHADYAFGRQSQLGAIHQISFSYQIKK